ncbi:MAG: DUF202 domain-containing protein [Rudaea sp.]
MNHDDETLELTRRMVYLAAERNLTSWIRTALSLMALGFVIDRFGLILHSLPVDSTGAIYPRILSTWGGSILIGMGVIMTFAAGVRYLHFALAFRRSRDTEVHNGMYVGALFSLLLGVFGIVLIVLLTAILK